jgi:hypothetical protein
MAKQGTTPLAAMGKVFGWLAQLTALLFACHSAFTIRTFAIEGYGRLIHECVALQSRAAWARAWQRRGTCGWLNCRAPQV